MPLKINSNIVSLFAQRNLNRTQSSFNSNINRLASGLRINKAADDAAALAISEGLRADMRSAQQAGRNIGDGMSMVRTAEGTVSNQRELLGRMRELAVQSSSGTLNPSDRSIIQEEFSSLQSEFDRLANSSEFNGLALNDGSAAPVGVQVGIQNTPSDQITVNLSDTRAAAVGVDAASADVSTQGNAQSAIDAIDGALDSLNNTSAGYGAVENRLSSAYSSYQTTFENMYEAESRIRDADYAAQTADFSRNQILQQAGMAVLAQANSLPSTASSLIG